MPAFVKSRFGESGIKLDEGTMVCPFDLKKSRKDCRISVLVINCANRSPPKRWQELGKIGKESRLGKSESKAVRSHERDFVPDGNCWQMGGGQPYGNKA